MHLPVPQEGFQPVAKRMRGFAWRAERPELPTFVEQKWGYRAEKPGDGHGLGGGEGQMRGLTRCRPPALLCLQSGVDRASCVGGLTTAERQPHSAGQWGCSVVVKCWIRPSPFPAGSWVELEVSTEERPGQPSDQPATVHLGYLCRCASCR